MRVVGVPEWSRARQEMMEPQSDRLGAGQPRAWSQTVGLAAAPDIGVRDSLGPGRLCGGGVVGDALAEEEPELRHARLLGL